MPVKNKITTQVYDMLTGTCEGYFQIKYLITGRSGWSWDQFMGHLTEHCRLRFSTAERILSPRCYVAEMGPAPFVTCFGLTQRV